MKSLPLTIAAVLLALPVFAQDAAPDEPLPPTTVEDLPPGGQAPVDQIPAISDVAPDGGVPDATATAMSCSFQTECVDAECAESGFAGRLTVISDGAGMAEAEWDDDAESLAFSAVLNNGSILASSTTTEPPGQRLLTILANGEARYTTHLTDPIHAISYVGTCEVAQ
ncbi:hypothetical protein [Paracoccus xiamenensis]|uniref:hypothetical protein n=1 Tax=Paracoccus xiamenensis TaxID=2714901 RepID=UPI00140DA25D|nr:hypothetical protein [Paracoccus xiamenensis]NHF71822.1 hypothetical protein [Paracoccus xiamenensis]